MTVFGVALALHIQLLIPIIDQTECLYEICSDGISNTCIQSVIDFCIIPIFVYMNLCTSVFSPTKCNFYKENDGLRLFGGILLGLGTRMRSAEMYEAKGNTVLLWRNQTVMIYDIVRG